MQALQINPSSPVTSRLMNKFPDRLLREEAETCGVCRIHGKHHPGCSCPDPDILPFDEQPLTALFGSQGIKVYVPAWLLRGLGTPQQACDELMIKLNEAFDSDEVIYCEPCEQYFCIDFAPTYASFVFFRDMAKKRAWLHTEIEASVQEIVNRMLLTASVSQEVCS